MAGIAVLTPSCAGVTYARLNVGEQLQWPVRDANHAGTPVLQISKLTRGLGASRPPGTCRRPSCPTTSTR